MTSRFPTDRIRGIGFPPPPVIAEAGAGVDPAVVRMNLNEAPFPPSPGALAAAMAALEDANRYPDHGCTELGREVSRLTGIPVERISFGIGSSELLIALAMLAIEPGDEAIVPGPTFPACLKGVEIAGGELVSVAVRPGGENDVGAMLAALTDRTRLFYLCTPNNPTGGIVGRADLARAARGVPDACLLVIDEAYFEFSAHEGGPDVLAILEDRAGPWAVTRSFSKAYCLAGLRVGYALTGGADVRSGVETLRASFGINRVALAAAVAAIRDQEHLRQTLERTIAERARIAGALEKRGFTAYPSRANFITLRPPGPAREITTRLAAKGILVQYVAWPDSHGVIRITVGLGRDTDRLIAALDRISGPG